MQKSKTTLSFLLGDLLIDVTFGVSRALRDDHLAEVASLHRLQVISVAGLNVNAIPHYYHEVSGVDLGEVVRDDNGGLVLAPLSDSIGDQDSGGDIKGRSSLVCERGQKS